MYILLYILYIYPTNPNPNLNPNPNPNPNLPSLPQIRNASLSAASTPPAIARYSQGGLGGGRHSRTNSVSGQECTLSTLKKYIFAEALHDALNAPATPTPTPNPTPNLKSNHNHNTNEGYGQPLRGSPHEQMIKVLGT